VINLEKEKNYFKENKYYLIAIAIAVLLAVFVNRILWLLVETFTLTWGIHMALVIGGIIGIIFVISGLSMNVKSVGHGVSAAGVLLAVAGLGTLLLPKYPEFKTVLVGSALVLVIWLGLKFNGGSSGIK